MFSPAQARARRGRCFTHRLARGKRCIVWPVVPLGDYRLISCSECSRARYTPKADNAGLVERSAPSQAPSPPSRLRMHSDVQACVLSRLDAADRNHATTSALIVMIAIGKAAQCARIETAHPRDRRRDRVECRAGRLPDRGATLRAVCHASTSKREPLDARRWLSVNYPHHRQGLSTTLARTWLEGAIDAEWGNAIRISARVFAV